MLPLFINRVSPTLQKKIIVMDPDSVETCSQGHGAIPNIRANVPPMRGDALLAVATPPIKEVGPIFDHEDLSNNGCSSIAACLHPLLSQVGGFQGSASFGHNLPRNISVMLCISPQLVGGGFRFIFLDTNKHLHQDSLLAYFNSTGGSIHVLPYPNFEEFLQSNFLHPRHISFLSNFTNLNCMLSAGHCILRDNNYSGDAQPNLSWLPTVPHLFCRTTLLLRRYRGVRSILT
jgi:hypothetical protein